MRDPDRSRLASLMVNEQKKILEERPKSNALFERARKSLLALGALVWLTGCASIGPPLPPSLELPKPPSDLRAARKGDRVTLTWTIPARTTDRQRIRYLGKTRICRSVVTGLTPAVAPASAAAPGITAQPRECGPAVGEVAPPADFTRAGKSSAKKVTATFTDTLSSAIQQANPTGFAAYAVEVLNPDNRGAGVSNQAHVPLVPTIAPFGGFTARPTAPGVLISWQCPPWSGRRTEVKYLFRIYRRPESSASATKIAEVDATGCAEGPSGLVPLASPDSIASPSITETNAAEEPDKSVTSFLDQTIEWENTYFYRGAVVSVIESARKAAVEVEGDDTPEVKVFAHDVFPPAVPAGLQAVFSGPGQQPFIDLIWAPVTDADLEGYNVYRHEEGEAAVKLNSEPVKIPAFRDTQVVAGKKYSYSVSAVDQRGNESARSEEAGESVP